MQPRIDTGRGARAALERLASLERPGSLHRPASPLLRCAAPLAAIALAACSSSAAPPSPQLASLGIEVAASSTRAWFFTNKGDAYFYGEAAGPQQTSWQGFNVRSFTFVDDWQWGTPAGTQGNAQLASATVFPDHAVRRYASGLGERVTLLDGLRALLLEPAGSGPLTLRPLLADSASAASYQVQAVGGALQIARKNHLAQIGPGDYPVWLVVKSAQATASAEAILVAGAGIKPKMTSPGALSLPAAAPVVFAVGASVDEATATADQALAQAAQLTAARAARMQALLDDSYLVTADPAFNTTLAWVRLSMDALVMEQQGKGIFAGLPWFNNYWGRDTFITLGGSHLATGRWEEAKEILTAFAGYQDIDTNSPTYGRIPNTVSLGGVSYNTADGTPWFVIQAHQAWLRSGDAAFAAAIWPVVRRATDGSLQRMDAQGFLQHGDQETWMDATGPQGPYTPRGTRAVEIQGLWYQQLGAAAALANAAGDGGRAAGYAAAAEQVGANFEAAYYNPAGVQLYDCLTADGTPGAPGRQVRPNQLLALRSFAGRIDPAKLQQYTRDVAERLAYPHGLASLWPSDPFFHPYHLLPGYYPKDEAYHNGVVWGWNNGPLVSLMAAQGAGEKAYQLVTSLGSLALTRATIGALPELLDALPQPVPDQHPFVLGDGLPQPAGTPFQAWTHGEYLRNVYEDFLGVRWLGPDRAELAPALPAAWGATRARFRLGSGHVLASITPGKGTLEVQLTGEDAPPGARVTVRALGASQQVALSSSAQSVHLAGSAPASTGWEGFAWRPYELDPNLPALKYPGFVILDRAAIKQAPGADVRTRLSLTDPAGDDTGPPGAHYTYPTDTHFAPGVLDLTSFELREDSGGLYFDLGFANLVQPGWNPGDGFQLTYAAVLFDTHAGGGATAVGHVANYSLPDGGNYQTGVYVGAGFVVEDPHGLVQAGYGPIPGDVVDPLGSPDTRHITFRVPKSVMPSPPPGTTVTVLVGSQDDYGNGSMGNFRVVDAAGSQWTGGGKPVSTDPNVYDFAVGTVGP